MMEFENTEGWIMRMQRKSVLGFQTQILLSTEGVFHGGKILFGFLDMLFKLDNFGIGTVQKLSVFCSFSLSFATFSNL